MMSEMVVLGAQITIDVMRRSARLMPAPEKVMKWMAVMKLIFEKGVIDSATADILGTVVGVSLAIAAFAIVIWSYEKSLPPPLNSLPPSEEEIKHVISIANSHIGGEEE